MRRFLRSGHVAIKAEALWDLFGAAAQAQASIVDGVAIVTISGPLTSHDEGWWDSYDAIRSRVAQALASSARAVVLKICSPGGDASGSYETARELRAMAARAGKPLYAYADGLAASAAYALACAASRIHVPSTGFVGSIGVIKAHMSFAEADRLRGLHVELVASGARKTDGNPAIPISPEALAASQREVDDLALLFFELVSESRGISVGAVQALEAGVFHGERAVGAGLADAVTTFEGLLAIASGKSGAAAEENTMDLKEIVAALKAAAEGEGEEADKAKKALAALEGEGDEPKKDEPKKDAEGAKSEGEGEEPKKDPPEEEPKKDQGKASASVETRLRELETREERASLLASRPDLNEKTRAWLATAPIETVREAVKAIEKPKVPNLAKAASVAATLPASPAAGEARPNRLPADEARALDEQMGLAKPAAAIRREGTKLILGVLTPAEARAELARREKVSP